MGGDQTCLRLHSQAPKVQAEHWGFPRPFWALAEREDRLSVSQIRPHFPHPKPIPPPTFLKTASVPPPILGHQVSLRPLNSSPLTSPRCTLFCLHSAIMPDGAALSPDWTTPESMFTDLPDSSFSLTNQSSTLDVRDLFLKHKAWSPNLQMVQICPASLWLTCLPGGWDLIILPCRLGQDSSPAPSLASV